jgi:alkanesulfonate monooxygenase SsuD/methylene tetrahydromethanopterin reductase-like flavin-dependent oxidoreductase (luciferase family)
MKFGMFFELSVPRPWTAGGEKAVYENSLEQAKLADELGFDQIWAPEHHFMEEYSHCSAPEVFLTACAMVTKRIRIGHGIVCCVPEMNHPVRIAERAAALDILSNGRLEFGTGRSATWTELGGFLADPDSTKSSWDEFVRAIPQMWMQEHYSHDGKHFSMPERNVLPKPLQTPHPPMWLAISSPGTEIDAGRRGLGHLGVSFGEIAVLAKRIEAYRRAIRSCEPAGAFVNEQVNAINYLFCHEDREYAIRTGQRLAGAFSSTAAQTMAVKESYPTPNYQKGGQIAVLRRAASERPGTGGALPEGLAFGDPDTVISLLRMWESAGVDRVVFMVNCVETIPQKEVLDSMRMFAREVMPVMQTPEERVAQVEDALA